MQRYRTELDREPDERELGLVRGALAALPGFDSTAVIGANALERLLELRGMDYARLLLRGGSSCCHDHRASLDTSVVQTIVDEETPLMGPDREEAFHDPLGNLARRYEHDALAQLLLIVEQLDVAAALLGTEAIADARAALILLDHHAEILLRRHCEATFRAGDGTGPWVQRTYTQDERNKVRQHFKNKVDLAAGVDALGNGTAPLIDLDSAACLKLAHRHRNAAYHRDDHNPRVLYLICLLQFDAVCRMLPAITPGVSFGLRDGPVPDALQRHGVDAGKTHGLRHGIHLPTAAEQVAKSLCDGLELPLPAIKAALATDLLDRSGQAIEVLKYLLESGLDSFDPKFAIEHSEFWDKHGSDKELVELLHRSDHWRRRGPDDGGVLSDEVEADMAEANALRNARVVELRRKFRPSARQEHVFAASRGSERLLDDSTLAEVVSRYDELDANLMQFERYLPAAVRAFDEIVERQVDALRER